MFFKFVSFLTIKLFLFPLIFADEIKQPQDERSKEVFEVVEKQLQSLRTGDYSKAYLTFTTKEFRKQTSLDSFKQFIKNFPVFSKNKTLTLNEIHFENQVVSLKGVLTSLEDETYLVEYELIKEDGRWKILGIQIIKIGTNNRDAHHFRDS